MAQTDENLIKGILKVDESANEIIVRFSENKRVGSKPALGYKVNKLIEESGYIDYCRTKCKDMLEYI